MRVTRRTKRLLVVALFGLVTFTTFAWSRDWLAWWPQEWARQALARRDYESAWRWAQRAMHLDHHNAETEFLWARLERKRGHLDEVSRHLQRAAKLGVDHERIDREALLAQAQTGALDGILTQLDRLLIDHSDEGAEICEAYANGLLVNGQIDAARSVIQQWQVAFPADPQADNLLGRLAEFDHSPTEAEEHYRRALAKNPRHFSSAYGLGRTLMELNRWQEAFDAYQTCLLLPVKAAAQVGMARSLAGLGQDEQALQLLHAAAETPREVLIDVFKQLGEPTESDILSFELGTLETRLGHSEAAIRWLRRAVDYNPKHRQAQYQLAIALNAAGRSAEAEQCFERYSRIQSQLAEIDRLYDVVKADPENIDARFRLGALCLEADSESAGLFWLRSVLARDPNHQPTHEKLREHRQPHGLE